MSGKPVVPRRQALRDIEDAVDYYASEASERVALRFVDAVERSLRTIGLQRGAGSPRYAFEVNLPGLRGHVMRRFPFIIFYVEQDDRIDVWRVLHGSRDIPSWLRPPDADWGD